MAHFRRRRPASAILALFVVLALFGAIAPAAGAQSDPAIISALDGTGRYLELPRAGIDGAITAANAEGIAFAWLDQGGDSAVAVSLADDYVDDLDQLGSRYHTVVVLTDEGFAASSVVYSQAELDRALDASFDSFRIGDAGPGLETLTQVLTGALTGGTTATSSEQSGSTDPGATDSSATDSGATDSGNGIGFGTIILGIAAVGGGFLLIRGFSNRRKVTRQATIDMEEDRAEIKEQLKNNADRVISLGDKVIAKGDQGLISRYEEASMAYQEVSQSVDEASDPAEVDALDNKIDHAEWQFEVIEAELNGLPVPRSPEERRADEASAAETGAGSQPPPPRGAPTEPPVATSPTTGRRYPRTTGSSRRGGGLGGGLGSILGGILGNVVLGGLSGGNRSRRSQRRGGGLGDVFGGGSGRSSGRKASSGGGLGGGVLRRGGSSSASRGKKPRISGSGRNRGSGRSRSRGGRSF